MGKDRTDPKRKNQKKDYSDGRSKQNGRNNGIVARYQEEAIIDDQSNSAASEPSSAGKYAIYMSIIALGLILLVGGYFYRKFATIFKLLEEFKVKIDGAIKDLHLNKNDSSKKFKEIDLTIEEIIKVQEEQIELMKRTFLQYDARILEMEKKLESSREDLENLINLTEEETGERIKLPQRRKNGIRGHVQSSVDAVPATGAGNVQFRSVGRNNTEKSSSLSDRIAGRKEQQKNRAATGDDDSPMEDL